MKRLLFLIFIFMSFSASLYIDSLKVDYNTDKTFANLSLFIVNNENLHRHICVNIKGDNIFYSKSFSLKPNKDILVNLELKGNSYYEINENISISIIYNCEGNEVKYKFIYPIHLNKTKIQSPLILVKNTDKPTIIIEYTDKMKYKIDNLISFGLSFILFSLILLFTYNKLMRDHHAL